MNTLKKCRFIKAWRHYRVGDVITPNGTLRDALLRQGFIEIAENAPPTLTLKRKAG